MLFEYTICKDELETLYHFCLDIKNNDLLHERK